MTVIQKTAYAPYLPAKMYALVNDIEHYPEFLPGCRSTEVYSRTEEEIRARIEFAKAGVSYAFSTLNRLYLNERIELSLLEGPFRQLQGHWVFTAEGEGGCRIDFKLEFEFINRLMDKIAGPALQGITDKFVDAFCKRAEALYGSKM